MVENAMTKKQDKNPLLSQKGETLAEALVAMLVVAFGAIILAGMVMAASNVIKRSEKSYNEYLDRRNYIETRGKDRTHNADSEQNFGIDDRSTDTLVWERVDGESVGQCSVSVKLLRLYAGTDQEKAIENEVFTSYRLNTNTTPSATESGTGSDSAESTN